jgi:hypothetical protein
MSHDIEKASSSSVAIESSEEATPLASLAEVYGFKRELGDEAVYICLDSQEELMASGRAELVIDKAAEVLERQDPRSTLVITNDQYSAEVLLSERPELFGKFKEALAQAALGNQPAPIVEELPGSHGYPSYIAVELYPESNAVIIRRGADSELVPRGEPPEGWNPLPFLATNTEPYGPIGGLTEGDDGFSYDTLGVFPRFATGEGKISIAFILKQQP